MGTERHHVLVLNQYAWPDSAVTGRFASEIAAAIAAAGHRVTFVAGQPSYLPDQPPAPRRETVAGVSYRRVGLLTHAGRRTRLARFTGYAVYLLRAASVALGVVRREGVDTIICFHNPPFLALLGAALARRPRRFICCVQDLHPDVLVATGWLTLPSAVIWLWNRLNHWAYTRASVVVVISADMRAALLETGLAPERVVSIPIWAEPELAPAPADPSIRAEIGLAEDPLLILFAGNMGLTQHLEPVFAAAQQLRDEPVQFCFVGGGIHAARWQAQAAHLPNVRFLAFQPETVYRRLVAASDVGLVTLAPALERLVVPSRAFPLLSAGIPLLAVMSPDCELGRMVRENHCGACVLTPEDLAGAVRAWLEDREALRAAGRRASETYQATRSRAVLTRRYVDLVEAG
jgi:glycosyltransferase involved in cell wall biosynthesis